MEQEKPEPSLRSDPYEITEMPDKTMLEDFLRGMAGKTAVIYRMDKGVFERLPDHPQP